MNHKAFFSYASEDKSLVEAVYERVLAESPDLAAWLDKYEILAGESLIDRIAAGMDDSDKFVIFLSPVSIKKPWVKRELRRALMREIQGVDPDFIIPVLIGDITAVPTFLEDKKYIALHKMTEDEWLPELIAAIRGIRPTPSEDQAENLVVSYQPMPGQPHIVRIVFEAQFWAERVSFGVKTSQNIVRAVVEQPSLSQGASGNLLGPPDEQADRREFLFSCEHPKIEPGSPAIFVLEFAPGVDAVASIEGAGRWISS